MSAVVVTCPTCGANVRVQAAGKAFGCPRCREPLKVPTSAIAQQPRAISPVGPPSLQAPEFKGLPKPGFPWLPVVLVAAPVLILMAAGVALVVGILAGRHAEQAQASAQPPAAMPTPPAQPEPPPPEPPQQEQTEFDMDKGPASYRYMTVGLSASIDNFDVQADDSVFPSPKEALLVAVRITNTSETRTIHYAGWNDEIRPPCTIRDEFNNNCFQQAFTRSLHPVKQAKFTLLQPHESVDDLLVFEAPSPAAKRLTLTVPLDRVDLGPDSADSLTLTFAAPPRAAELRRQAAEKEAQARKEQAERDRQRAEAIEKAAAQEAERQRLANEKLRLEAEKKAKEEQEVAEREARAEKERQDAIKKADDERQAAAEAAARKKEDERRQKLEAQGLPYYPSPTTFYKGDNAEEWYKYTKDPSGVMDDGIAALVALREEGVPYLLDLLQHATDQKRHTAFLLAIKPELIHPNDVKQLITSLDRDWSTAARILALTYLSKRKEARNYYESIAYNVDDIKDVSDVNGDVRKLLEAIHGK